MSQITILENALKHLLLNSAFETEEDFYCLAVTGEQLRRAILMEDNPTLKQSNMLARYTEVLSRFVVPVLPQIEQEIDALLDSLREYASNSERDSQEGKQILNTIEEWLNVAKALHLKDMYTAIDIQFLIDTVGLAVNAVSAELSELWEYADAQDCALAPDLDFPDLYSFWEELAVFSETRLLMQEAAGVMPEADRQASIERIMKKMTS